MRVEQWYFDRDQRGLRPTKLPGESLAEHDVYHLHEFQPKYHNFTLNVVNLFQSSPDAPQQPGCRFATIESSQGTRK